MVANSKVLFAFVKADLPKNALGVLENIVKSILDENPNIKIILKAYTNNIRNSISYNYELSIKRTSIGKKYLNSIGVADEKL